MSVRLFGAALLLFCLSTSAAQTQPPTGAAERIEIVLSNFAFSPSSIHLKQGQSYLLHFVNKGSGGHNFAAKSFFAAAQINGVAPANGVVELRKGESRDLALVPAAGRYKVKCTHFLHAGFGMKGEVVVD